MKKLFRRQQASDYLASLGLRSSKMMLARMAVVGDGPKYAIIGHTAYYTQEWLDEWLESQLKSQTEAKGA